MIQVWISGMVALALWLTGGMGTALAGDFPAAVKKPVSDAIVIRQETQKNTDQWVAERARLEAVYDRLQKENAQLSAAGERMRQQVDARQAAVLALEAQLADMAKITEALSPFLEKTYERLRDLIREEPAFLPPERQNRLDNLRRVLDDPLTPAGEKLRKLMETLFVEAEYGNTLEVYQEQIRLADRSVLVDVLRLGRISLFFQTLDRRTCGFFNPATEAWQMVPARYNRAIHAAIEIGTQRRSAELLEMPLGKVVAP